jgi:hypothetical protein
MGSVLLGSCFSLGGLNYGVAGSGHYATMTAASNAVANAYAVDHHVSGDDARSETIKKVYIVHSGILATAEIIFGHEFMYKPVRALISALCSEAGER